MISKESLKMQAKERRVILNRREFNVDSCKGRTHSYITFLSPDGKREVLNRNSRRITELNWGGTNQV